MILCEIPYGRDSIIWIGWFVQLIMIYLELDIKNVREHLGCILYT